jgi:hypothetical protein
MIKKKSTGKNGLRFGMSLMHAQDVVEQESSYAKTGNIVVKSVFGALKNNNQSV